MALHCSELNPLSVCRRRRRVTFPSATDTEGYLSHQRPTLKYLCQQSVFDVLGARLCWLYAYSQEPGLGLSGPVARSPPVSSAQTDWMLWVQNTGAPLVNLSSQGKVRFLEPREGRVKTFPNEGSRGNYTIRIDGLQESDLGCYQCGPADACHQVVVQKEEVDLWLPLCITAGVTTVILFVCFCCYKAFSRCKGCSLSQRGTRKRQENDEQDPADIGLSEDERLARNQDQGPPETIHDYEEQSESVAPCRPVRGHPQLERTRSTERKHALLNREIFSRLRQASRHFYVNQDEIIQQRSSAQKERRPRAGLRGKKAKQRYENPLYNSSPSQINHL